MVEVRKAQRQNVRQYTPSPVNQIGDAVRGIAQATSASLKEIQRINQEAKITSNASTAQIGLNKLQNDFQNDNQSDPFANEDKFKKERNKLFKTLQRDITPSYQGQWNQSVQSLEARSDLTMQNWQFKQSKVNTVDSINTTMQNNFTQSFIDGKSFGTGDGSNVETMLNFEAQKNDLLLFGNKNIGEERTNETMKNYNSDSLTSFISGVIETNPISALSLLEDKKTMSTINDPDVVKTLTDSAKERINNIDDIRIDNEIIAAMRSPNSLLAESQTRQLSIVEIETVAKESNMSNAAKNVLLKKSGYKDVSKQKVSPSAQVKGKADIYSSLDQISRSENLTTKQVSDFQNKIYVARDKGFITDKETTQFINEITDPLVSQKEIQLQEFSHGNWNPFFANVGLSGLNDYYSKNLKIKPIAGQKEVGGVSAGINNSNKVKLYDYYLSNLDKEAKKQGINITDLNNLPASEKNELYYKAQSDAQRMMILDKHPSLSTLKDIPNKILDNGNIIQGAAGNRQVNPDFTIQPEFTVISKQGRWARKYSDGRIEEFPSQAAAMTGDVNGRE